MAQPHRTRRGVLTPFALDTVLPALALGLAGLLLLLTLLL